VLLSPRTDGFLRSIVFVRKWTTVTIVLFYGT